MSVPDTKRLKALESESAKLKRLLAESMLENEMVRVKPPKKVVKAPAHYEVGALLLGAD